MSAAAQDTTPASAPARRYGGLATRTVGFLVDAAIINLAAIAVALGVSLVLSVLFIPKSLRPGGYAIAGAAYLLWTLAYFLTFWSTTGQTPGARLMQVRVVGRDGQKLRPLRAIVRWIALLIAALPLFAGYALILFDSRRRGLHDRLAGTLVVEVERPTIAAQLLTRRRAAPAAPSLSRPASPAP